MNSNIILYLLLYLNIVSFILGYLCSRIRNNNNAVYSGNHSIKKTNQNLASSSIEIQDSKYVVAIDTSNMEKKYSELGETKTTKENVTESINKLKNLKK